MNSLQGQEIEPYANELFRHGGSARKTKNNGVLLLVAPKEKKIRIEVGYGLEGTLTDALSKIVIVNAIAPRFKAGDFAGGITRGVDDVITILTTDSSEWTKKPQVRPDDPEAALDAILPFLIVALVIFIIWRSSQAAVAAAAAGAARRRRTFIILPGPGWNSGGGRFFRRLFGWRRRLFRRRRLVGRRRRFRRLVMKAQADENAIVAAVRAAEARTSGQIVCVLARRSCDPSAFVDALCRSAGVDYALAIARIGRNGPAQTVFAVQIAVFILALLALGWTPLGIALTPHSVKRRHAYRAALEQFFIRGLPKTRISRRRADFRLVGRTLRAHRRGSKIWTGKISEEGLARRRRGTDGLSARGAPDRRLRRGDYALRRSAGARRAARRRRQ